MSELYCRAVAVLNLTVGMDQVYSMMYANKSFKADSAQLSSNKCKN